MHRNAFTQQQTAKFTMSSLQISLSLRVDESRHDAADWARVWSPSVGKPDAMGEEEDVNPEGEQQCGWVVQIDLPTNKHTPMTHHTMKSCHRPSLQNNCTKEHGIEAQTGSIRNGSIRNGSMKLCAALIFWDISKVVNIVNGLFQPWTRKHWSVISYWFASLKRRVTTRSPKFGDFLRIYRMDPMGLKELFQSSSAQTTVPRA